VLAAISHRRIIMPVAEAIVHTTAD